MEDTNKVQRLEEKIDTLEAALTYQTELLEAQAERERKRKIWFWIKTGVVAVALLILIPKGVALYQQTEGVLQQAEGFLQEMDGQVEDLNQEVSEFLDETSDQIGAIASAMQTMQRIVSPLEEFMTRWKLVQ